MVHDLAERALLLFAGLHVVSEVKTAFADTLHSLLEDKELSSEERNFLTIVLGGMRLRHLASASDVTEEEVIESLWSRDKGEFLGVLNLMGGGCLPASCITSEVKEGLVDWLSDPTKCPLRMYQEVTSRFVETHVAQAILGMYRKEIAWFEDDVIRKASEITDEQVQMRLPMVEA